MRRLRVVLHASELLTGAGLRRKDGRRPLEEDLDRIEDGALVYSEEKRGTCWVPERVEWVGETRALPRKFARVRALDLRNERAVIPGLVDCHTHLVFAGDRSEEFALRCAGATYEEIARRGGGIVATVEATRASTEKRLLELAEGRLRELLAFGVRTVEIKSGYGLAHDAELKLLRVAKQLRKRHPEVVFHVTYLGAHAFPKGIARDGYLAEILERTLPAIAKGKLADACDVFIERGYFTLEEGERVLIRAAALGLATHVHADELTNSGAAALAARIGALSADHLLQVSTQGVRALAASDTVAVLLPGTAFYLKAEHAPARKLIDAGACVALATDFNPGTSMTLSLPAVMTIAALYLGMTRAEIFAAVTYNGAKALGLSSTRGTLEVGQDAAFAVLPFGRFEECYYRFAWSPQAYSTRE